MTVECRLKHLMNRLQKLVALLRLDPDCQWLLKFQSDLDFCSRLVHGGYTQSELGDLSNSITYVFQGMGSFNDYAPAKYDSKSGKYLPIPGTENYESVSKEVFDRARDLIIRP